MSNDRIIIASNGKTTDIMINGRVYGDGVVKIEFVHDHKDGINDARLLITADRTPLTGTASDEERQGFMKKLEEYSREQKGDEKSEGEVVEKTKALAELISARAKFPVNEAEIKNDLKSTEELADIVLEHLRNIPECQKSIELSSSELFRDKQTP